MGLVILSLSLAAAALQRSFNSASTQYLTLRMFKVIAFLVSLVSAGAFAPVARSNARSSLKVSKATLNR